MTASRRAPTPWLSAAEILDMQRVARWFGGWGRTPRRRRLFFLLLAAPGFFGVFATPLHRSLALLVGSALLFAAACVLRARSEPLFVRAEAAALWPPVPEEPARD